jgi:hypothetical protein
MHDNLSFRLTSNRLDMIFEETEDISFWKIK